MQGRENRERRLAKSGYGARMTAAAMKLLQTPLVQKAIADGLLSLDQGETHITYNLARTKTYAVTHSEEPVRAWVVAFLILERGYPTDCIDLEVPVQMGSETKAADVVLYKDPKL